VNPHLIVLPAFEVIGPKTYISGLDNEQFGQFWEQCRTDGRLQTVHLIQQLSGKPVGRQTKGFVLGVSRVEMNPAKRDFDYMIAVEVPEGGLPTELACDGLSRYTVPASLWAVFECDGEMPGALVASEMYAFMEWLPTSGYQHALAPEMEVYTASQVPYCEFWLPICRTM